MSTNLTPQYIEAEKEFRQATTPEAKLEALENMLRLIPKHKGTEKMQADLKRRLSKLRKDHQKEKSSGVPKRPFYYIEKEGIGRVVVSGPANSGKSSLLGCLTNADPEIADYPFTTRAPQPGMMQYEDVQIQLVDMPPLAREVFEPWQIAMLEQADVGVLLFDVADSLLLDQTAFVLEQVKSRGLALPPDPESSLIILGNKVDLPEGKESFEAWQELFEDDFQAIPFSTAEAGDLLTLKKLLFDRLEVVRVYTKPPGGKPERDQAPYVLDRGSTVLEAAAMVHKDLAETFKFARIWGAGLYEGQMVERDYILQDGDLLEIHS